MARTHPEDSFKYESMSDERDALVLAAKRILRYAAKRNQRSVPSDVLAVERNLWDGF